MVLIIKTTVYKLQRTKRSLPNTCMFVGCSLVVHVSFLCDDIILVWMLENRLGTIRTTNHGDFYLPVLKNFRSEIIYIFFWQ